MARSTNRDDPTWIPAPDAAARLGVKTSTLYTYASRGWVRVRPTGGRSRLYFAPDVEALRQRALAHAGHEPRAAGALAFGEPVLTTAISAIDRDGPYYRGVPAVDLLDAPLAEVAARMWACAPEPWPAVHVPPAADLRALRRTVDAAELPADPFDQARRLAAIVAAACALPDHPDVRAAQILCVDHELNASTFTARVVASTGADLQACVVAALAAFAGDRHGQASLGLARMLDGADPPDGVWPGFHHPLYPDGDPRGEELLARARILEPARLDGLERWIARAAARGHRPNLDAGLLALGLALGEPASFGWRVFAAGRVVGWIAHVFEQRTLPGVLRPRARYVWPA